MSAAAAPPPDARQVGDNFFRPFSCAFNGHGHDYLQPGQTEWVGPLPPSHADYVREGLQWYPRRQERRGVRLLVTLVGQYVRFHRLAEGPTHKLSDWKQLAAGRRMLLSLAATGDDVEKAHTRATYMRAKGYGRFRPAVDEDGALWVERL